VVESGLACLYVLRVRSLRTAISLLLVLTWVPLTSHCELETIPGLEFLACAADPQGPGQADRDCQDAGCCSIESAQYVSSRSYEFTTVCSGPILPFHPLVQPEPLLSREAGPGLLTAAPPELPHSWQFASRAALPPRAPTFVS
jgi:hypothetical protein